MKTLSKPLLSAIFIAMALSSCYNDNKEEVYENNTDNTCDTSSVSYANDITPIFEQSCTSGCHSGTNPAANLDLTDFNEAKNSANEIVNRINDIGALMPQGGPSLPDCEILKIETWVQDGAPNN